MSIFNFLKRKPKIVEPIIKVDPNQKVLKQFFIDYFKRKEIDEQWWGISKITVITFDKGVKVIVELARPGLLIGKAGHNVRALSAELEAIIGLPVTFTTHMVSVWN